MLPLHYITDTLNTTLTAGSILARRLHIPREQWSVKVKLHEQIFTFFFVSSNPVSWSMDYILHKWVTVIQESTNQINDKKWAGEKGEGGGDILEHQKNKVICSYVILILKFMNFHFLFFLCQVLFFFRCSVISSWCVADRQNWQWKKFLQIPQNRSLQQTVLYSSSLSVAAAFVQYG